VSSAGVGGLGRILVLRLLPGEDLLEGVEQACGEWGLDQGVILSGVASLRRATVRNIHSLPVSGAGPITAEMRHVTRIPGPLELLFLCGNIARLPDGRLYVHCHAEFSLCRPPTETRGGHLVSGSPVATTAEIVLAEISGMRIARAPDPMTGAAEVVVEQLHRDVTGGPPLG
jgi:uncharacterized protein